MSRPETHSLMIPYRGGLRRLIGRHVAQGTTVDDAFDFGDCRDEFVPVVFPSHDSLPEADHSLPEPSPPWARFAENFHSNRRLANSLEHDVVAKQRVHEVDCSYEHRSVLTIEYSRDSTSREEPSNCTDKCWSRHASHELEINCARHCTREQQQVRLVPLQLLVWLLWHVLVVPEWVVNLVLEPALWVFFRKRRAIIRHLRSPAQD